MNICIPIDEDKGLQSTVCAHFGSAPFFLIVDTDTGACRALPNHNLHHGHGMCAPLASLQGESLQALVVGGIGGGAVAKLRAAGIEVFLAQHPTVQQTVDAFTAGALQSVTSQQVCGGHGHQGGGGHGGCGHQGP